MKAEARVWDDLCQQEWNITILIPSLVLCITQEFKSFSYDFVRVCSTLFFAFDSFVYLIYDFLSFGPHWKLSYGIMEPVYFTSVFTVS